MVCLTARRRAVLAIQGDVKNATAKLLAELGLERKAFDHARRHPAVVVTHRQKTGARLGT
jgi:hypothetical protein